MLRSLALLSYWFVFGISVVSAQSSQRVVVLGVSGDPTLAADHGADARERVRAALAADGHTVVLSPAACAELDCGQAMLSEGAADLALSIALWGGAALRVAVTLVNREGQTRGAEVPVAGLTLLEAAEAATRQAFATSEGGTILRVEGSPQGAVVTLDQMPWGTLPHEASVLPGPHTVSVAADGFRSQRREFSVAGEPVVLDFDLAPSQAAASAGPDGLLLGLGAGLVAVGLAGVVVGVVGFAMPPSASGGGLYERTAEVPAALWLSLGGTAVVAGVVTLVLGLSSSGAPAQARAFDGAIRF